MAPKVRMSTKGPAVRPSALRSPGSSTSTNLRVKVNKQFLKPSKTNPDKEIKDPKGTKRKAEVVENDSKVLQEDQSGEGEGTPAEAEGERS